MTNAGDTIRQAIQDARELQRALSHNAELLIEFLNEPGVLQRCSAYELRKLKTALRSFNMISGRWKKK